MRLSAAFPVVKLGYMSTLHITPEILKQIRRNLDLSQTEAAARCRVNLQTWWRWETGRREPDGPATIVLELLAAEANVAPVAA